MQSGFGSPTRTMVEIGPPDSLFREEIVQFEYWFLVNDDVPVLVLDVNGPWDRGLVFAAPKAQRDSLELMKEALLGQLMETDDRTAYADYYYNFDRRTWYITGYDGARFVDVRIDPPNLILGRPAVERLLDRTDIEPEGDEQQEPEEQH